MVCKIFFTVVRSDILWRTVAPWIILNPSPNPFLNPTQYVLTDNRLQNKN